MDVLLEKLFHDIKFKYVYHYLHDIVIYSESMEQHLAHLREVLSKRQKINAYMRNLSLIHIYLDLRRGSY